MTNIADRVRVKRNRLGLSGPELANKVGVTSTFIYDIESGKKKPSVETLIALADALECTVNDLIH